ncbi:hypothetical protein ACWCYZ_32880 [Streptomyces virginiae]
MPGWYQSRGTVMEAHSSAPDSHGCQSRRCCAYRAGTAGAPAFAPALAGDAGRAAKASSPHAAAVAHRAGFLKRCM